MIRHEKLTALPTTTFTLDALDGSGIPCTLDAISEDFSECYTRVVIRGGDNVQGAYLSLQDGTLVPAWSSSQQTAWNYASFVQPAGAFETGTISSMTSTTLNVTATSPASISYSTGYWSPKSAEVWAYNPIATGSAFGEQRRITVNTAPSSNSYTITVDTAFSNSGYTNYQVRGLANFQSATSPVDVWRKFWIAPTYVNQHLVQQFSHSVPWSGTDGVLVQTVRGMSDICFSAAGQYIEWPMSFTVVPYGTGLFTTQATITATVASGAVTGFSGLSGGSGYPPSATICVSIVSTTGSGATAYATANSSGVITGVTLQSGGSGYSTAPSVLIGISPGYILFDQPICASYCSPTTLNAGGSAIPSPTDVKVLVPYSTGPLTATAPSSGYSGTAYSINGVTRTLWLDIPSWLDYGDQAGFNTLAAEKLACVQNSVIEGSLSYYGKQATFLVLGQSLDIAGNGYTTGYESIAAPARSVVLDYLPDGGAAQWKTTINFSTRMKPFTGDRLYIHPAYAAAQRGGSGGLGSTWASAMNGSGGQSGWAGYDARQAAHRQAAQGGQSAGVGFNGDDGGDDYSGLMPGSAGTANRKPATSTRTPTPTPDTSVSMEDATAAAGWMDEMQADDPETQRRDRASSHGSLREARGLPEAAPPAPEESPSAPSWAGYDDRAQASRRQRAEDDGQ